MVDPIGAGAAAIAFIQTSISLIDRVLTAIHHQKHTITELSPVSADLSSVREALTLIGGRPELRTHGVESSIQPINDVVTTLGDHIDKMSAKADKFAHQFLKGDGERDKLESLILQLTAFKSTLILHICLAGLESFQVKQEVTMGVLIDYNSVQELSQDVRTRFGRQLYVMNELQKLGKNPDANGMIPLTKEEYRLICERHSLNAEKVQQAEQKIKITVKNNSADQAALQINGIMGELDPTWKDIGEINIEHNTVRGIAAQLNVPVDKKRGNELMAGHRDNIKLFSDKHPNILAQLVSQAPPPMPYYGPPGQWSQAQGGYGYQYPSQGVLQGQPPMFAAGQMPGMPPQPQTYGGGMGLGAQIGPGDTQAPPSEYSVRFGQQPSPGV